jgi:hypothetical protein
MATSTSNKIMIDLRSSSPDEAEGAERELRGKREQRKQRGERELRWKREQRELRKQKGGESSYSRECREGRGREGQKK